MSNIITKTKTIQSVMNNKDLLSYIFQFDNTYKEIFNKIIKTHVILCKCYKFWYRKFILFNSYNKKYSEYFYNEIQPLFRSKYQQNNLNLNL